MLQSVCGILSKASIRGLFFLSFQIQKQHIDIISANILPAISRFKKSDVGLWDSLNSLFCAFISCRIDYCNALPEKKYHIATVPAELSSTFTYIDQSESSYNNLILTLLLFFPPKLLMVLVLLIYQICCIPELSGLQKIQFSNLPKLKLMMEQHFFTLLYTALFQGISHVFNLFFLLCPVVMSCYVLLPI